MSTADTINTAETLYTPKTAYIVQQDSGGESYYFSQEYVDLIHTAFDTDCIAGMTPVQRDFFSQFTLAQDGLLTSENADALAALDALLVGLVNGDPIPTALVCA
ncbi:hypothetical protein WCX49_11730 [Sulfurimonas sp. HSL-1656]|uniref:hypothetical protein n=1 Tax=Thiomicrolovo subterrani TaxID=3131934 RepID=UPI0031F9215A